MYQVLESFTASRSGDETLNEDVLLDTPHWLIICDGASDKSGLTFDGVTGGRLTAQLVARTIAGLPSGTSPQSIVEHVNDVYHEVFADHLESFGAARPAAVFAALDKQEHRVIRVGDISWSDGEQVHYGQMRIDDVHIQMRAAYLNMLLLEGATISELMETDPGRALILPGLQKQGVLCNNPDAGELAYGAIDGAPVPDYLIESWDVQTDRVIMSTDGYPELHATLDESEAVLHELLADDPLRIGSNPGTKGVQPGHQSYDDRAYVRVQRC